MSVAVAAVVKTLETYNHGESEKQRAGHIVSLVELGAALAKETGHGVRPLHEIGAGGEFAALTLMTTCLMSTKVPEDFIAHLKRETPASISKFLALPYKENVLVEQIRDFSDSIERRILGELARAPASLVKTGGFDAWYSEDTRPVPELTE